jgi:hypothetical protein
MNARRSALCLIGGLLLSTLACCAYFRYRPMQAMQELPFDRYTARQIVDHTIPLCQAILPRTDGLRLFIERGRSYTSNGSARPLWRVQCTDTAGKHLAEFLWEAETGALALVIHNAEAAESSGSQRAFTSFARMPAEQTRAKAAWQAYRWLYRLGIAGERSRWRLTREPERSSVRCDVWYTRWQSENVKATVQVDAGADTLISAQSWRLTRPSDP